ncbi:serine/threonine protein phosphatase [Rhizobium sp. S-51]|uniref:Serine/threonine protein phosphatase n=1 Tax=Rhizobium terricola TaxID=2728849 RepID=A0A7Y0FUG7_9HYPH|nr:metallophosphoesterase family protein [Rhizobium terricola]NML72736.1 serine/threonine protein phosphatase [Rhizobium terricola]
MERHFDRFFPASRHATVTGHGRPRLEFAPDLYAAIYAVGDVHGCLAELLALEARISEDGRFIDGPKLIIMLGDYVDRGPTSRQVLDYLLSPPPEGFDRILLCGNHEDLFLQFMAQPEDNLDWLRFGGVETLMSYGIDVTRIMEEGGGMAALATSMQAEVPALHRALLQALPIAVKVGDFVFVHAGLRPGVALDAQKDEDLIWIREPFLARGPETAVTVVHGHTPSSMPSFGPGRIGIDTACYSTGRLTAARIVGNEAVIL